MNGTVAGIVVQGCSRAGLLVLEGLLKVDEILVQPRLQVVSVNLKLFLHIQVSSAL